MSLFEEYSHEYATYFESNSRQSNGWNRTQNQCAFVEVSIIAIKGNLVDFGKL